MSRPRESRPGGGVRGVENGCDVCGEDSGTGERRVAPLVENVREKVDDFERDDALRRQERQIIMCGLERHGMN